MRDAMLKEARDRMGKAVAHFQDELKGIRTGQASPALVEGIRVDYYGTPTPIKQLAAISIPEPRQIVLKPYDAGALGAIEKALLRSELGLTPQSDGRVVRLNLPPMSEEQRRKTVQRVKQLAEECRVAVRNIRRDLNRRVEQLKKDKRLSEDEAKSLQEAIQDETKKAEGAVDEVLQRKSTEIMET